MTTTIFDPTSLLRSALETWWTANSATLSALGTPIVAADDGSPASTETSTLPSVVVRLGDGALDATTNTSRMNTATVTFSVFHNTRHEATQAAAPLDRLLADMASYPSKIPALTEGRVIGVSLDRFNAIQLSKNRWRVSREVNFRIMIDRKPA